MSSFTADAVFEGLYLGILGRTPDSETRASRARMLEEGELDLPALVQEILSGQERQELGFTMDQVINALHLAITGKFPNQQARAALEERIRANPRSDVLSNLGAALYNSPELQNRLLPENAYDRLLVDHSPSGEFVAMLRLFLGANGRGLMVEVGLPTPSASYSIDFLRLSGWRGILIEPSAGLRSSIESRFSGMDFELIQARIGENISEASPQRNGSLAFDELENPSYTHPGLASVLTNVNVPASFEILAVSKSTTLSASEIINDLIETSDFRPALIIAELQPPLNWTAFSQLGLNDSIRDAYKVGFTTERSVFLTRR